MSLALRVLAALFICLSVVPLAHAQQRAEEVRFTHAGVQADAKRYETYLKANWQPKGSGAELRAEGDRLLAAGTDPRAASRAYAQAVVFDANDAAPGPDSPAPCSPSSPTRARSATNCPSTPRAPPGSPTSAARPGRQGGGAGGAVGCPQAALLLAPCHRRPEVEPEPRRRRAGARGLRRAGGASTASASSTTRSRTTAPSRACASSSPSAWRRARSTGRSTSRSTARTRRPSPPRRARSASTASRTASATRCGARRPALGDRRRDAAKTAELAVYVKDRARPCARRAAATCCPTAASRASRWSPSTPTRSTSRSIASATAAWRRPLQGGDFASRCPPTTSANLKERTGARVYAGELRRRLAPQRGRDTAFPVAEAIPELKPGVYVLRGHAVDQEGGRRGRPPARHAVVHRLRPRPHRHQRRRRHARLRALARRRRAGRRRERAPRRPQQRSARHRQDRRRGYVRFDAGLKRGEGGSAPAVLVAETPDGDYAFLDLSAAAFDLTDRGVKGRDAARPARCLRLHRPRRLSPGRDGAPDRRWCATRPARPRPCPSPSSSRVPTAWSIARDACTDQGLGGRATTLSLAGSAMTGTWRAKVHTDPKANPIAQTAFLVEDFVPERLELKLEPRRQALDAAAARRHQAGGPLSLRPAGRRPGRRRRDRRQARQGRSAGLCRLSLRPRGRADQRPCASRSKACPPPTPKARPTSPSAAGAAADQPAAGGRRDPEAARVRAAAPSSARSRCPSTSKSAAHRHQAAVQGRPGGRGRDRALRGDHARRRRQGRRRQGPQVGAAAPRPALAVVQPRRHVELRARDATPAASPPARPTPHPASRPPSRPRSIGAAIASR